MSFAEEKDVVLEVFKIEYKVFCWVMANVENSALEWSVKDNNG